MKEDLGLKPIISIIIPNYNRWNKLCRALDSIPKHENIQIIVIDDKSEDVDLYFDELKEKYREVIFVKNETREKNAGVARNIGLGIAEGEWVTFLDSDDYFLDSFEDIFNEICKETDSDIIYFPPISIDEKTECSSTRHLMYLSLTEKYLTQPNAENETKLRYWWDSPCSKLIRKSVIDSKNIRFDSVEFANDVMFSVKCACEAKTISVKSIPFYCIEKSGESLTANKAYRTKVIRRRIDYRRLCFLKSRLNRGQMQFLQYTQKSGIYYFLLAAGMSERVLRFISDKRKSFLYLLKNITIKNKYYKEDLHEHRGTIVR